jgi:hypothetical protein
MTHPEMPNPADHPRVRQLRALTEFALLLSQDPLVESVDIEYQNGQRVFLEGGVVKVTYDGGTYTVDQLQGYIQALEGDVLEAQKQLRRRDEG